MPDSVDNNQVTNLSHLKGPACMLSAVGAVVDHTDDWQQQRLPSGRRAAWPATLLDLEGYDPAAVDTAWNRVLDGHTAVVSPTTSESGLLVLTPLPPAACRNGVAVAMASIVQQSKSLRVRRSGGGDDSERAPAGPRLRLARRPNDTSLCADESSVNWMGEMNSRASSEAPRPQLEATPQPQVESDMLMARMLVHDLNNVFGGILGNADLALHLMESGEDATECLQWIRDISEHAVGLTQQLDYFAKPGPVNVQRIDLAKTLEFLASQMRTDGSEPCRLDIETNLWSCDGDYAQIYQALRQLLRNALQATPGQPVRIEAHNRSLGPADGMPTGNYVVIKIVDSGEGVPDALRDRIFEPGFSLKAGSRGQGLAIVRTIVDGHRGGIRCERESAERNVMRLSLPAANSKTDSPGISPSSLPRILVLDSREIVRYVFTRMGTMMGYRIEPAVSKNEVERLLREGIFSDQPHQVLMVDSRWFGEGDRCSALEDIRGAYPDLRVALMTDPKAPERDYGKVVDTVIAKPISMTSLRRLVDSLCPAQAGK